MDKIENSEFKRVSVNLPKCDDLIKKCNELPAHSDSVVNVDHISKLNPTTTCCSSKLSSKTMSISELFNEIITEARDLNQKQFCLPEEYLTDINLHIASTEKDSNNFTNDMDSNDLMKLPPRKCYYCKKICSEGEAVSCDFCPGDYHINCLSPPVCCIPDAKWMCPLHPHHMLNKIMERTYSITELSTWLDKVVNADNDNVENDFIKKIKSSSNKQIRRVTTNNSVKIPEVVKYHYEHSLAKPSILEEVTNPKQRRVLRNNYPTKQCDIMKNRYRKMKNMCFELNTSEDPRERFSSRSTTLIEIVNEDDSQNSGKSSTDQSAGSEENGKSSEDFSLWDPENKRFKFASYGIYDYDRLGFNLKTHGECKSTETKRTFHSMVKHLESVNHLNRKVFSWSRIQQIINRDIQNSFHKEERIRNETKHSIFLKERLKENKLHSMIRSYPPSFISDTVPYPFLSSLCCENSVLSDKPLKKVHAVLCPLSHQAPPIYMQNNILIVGTDISNDVHLMKYGTCEFLSEHHATIFYDEYTNTYELLNYSGYNCIVDGLCYSSDLSADVNARRWENNSSDSVHFLNKDNPRSVQLVVQTNSVKKINKQHPRKSFNAILNNKNKRFHTNTTTREREWRYAHQKLLQEIEKLVTKSQKEMTSIANEDLNEISKVLKTRKLNTVPSNKNEAEAPKNPSADVNEISKVLKTRKLNTVPLNKNEAEAQKNPSAVFIIKRKKKIFPHQKARLFPKNDKRNLRGVYIPKTSMKKGQIVDKEKVGLVRLSRNEPLNGCDLQRSTTEHTPSNCSTPLSILSNRKRKRNADEVVENVKRTSLNGCCENQERSNQKVQLDQMKNINETYQSKCGCQISTSEFPVGQDSSWETSAPLHHGSHIKFGCVEFVFCIVNNHSTDRSEYFYEDKEILQSCENDNDNDGQSEMCISDGESRWQMNNHDLSSKLTSILTVLSSDTDVSNRPSSLTSPVPLINNEISEDKKPIVAEIENLFEIESISNDETNSVSSSMSSAQSITNCPNNSENPDSNEKCSN